MRASYPTYKSTSIPWLPEMPEHWDALKAKHIFKERSEKGYPDEPLLAATQTKGVVRKEEYENRTVTAQKDFHLLKLVKEEDFVISLRSFQGGIEYAYHRGIISPAYTIFYERNKVAVNKAFYRHLFKSHPFINSLTLFVTGIREGQNIDYAEFKDSLLPFPPLPEQTAIANYLDAKTEQINRFIEKKEKLIALLKEQKQAVISELLSKNTDNWPLVKLKYILSEVNDRSETGKEELLSLSKYQGVIPKSKLEERAGGANSLIGYKKVYYDTIVVNKMQASNGIIGVSKVEGITSPDYSIYKVKSQEYSPDFIGYMLVQPNMLAEYKRVSTGVMDGYIRLYTDDLFDIKIAIPGKSQQLDVLNKIEQATTQINLTINQVEREVGKVKELKQSLIAEVVTGKIKVV